jgi:hypothetical protein
MHGSKNDNACSAFPCDDDDDDDVVAISHYDVACRNYDL